MKLREYVEKHQHLKPYLDAAVRCLPGISSRLDEVEVEAGVEMNEMIAGAVLDGGRLVIFREDPPDINTFLHELVHLAGGGEEEAYTLTLLLRLCAEKGVTADLMRLMNLTFEQLDKLVEEVTGLKGLEEWYALRGVIHPGVVELDVDEKGELTVRIVEGSELDAARLFIHELSLCARWDYWCSLLLTKLLATYANARPKLKLLPFETLAKLAEKAVEELGEPADPREVAAAIYKALGIQGDVDPEDVQHICEILSFFFNPGACATF